jgi:hypothetical protein
MSEERTLKHAFREEVFAFWTMLNRTKKYRFPVRVIIDNSAWWANLKTWQRPEARLTMLLPGQLN